jgi:hypothetical protein
MSKKKKQNKQTKQGLTLGDFEWTPHQVEVSKIKPTPNNFKIKTELGNALFSTSLSKYGIARAPLINVDVKANNWTNDMVLIDGNSLVEKAKKLKRKTIWVLVPNKKLTPAQFKEMNATFDYARAGHVDTERMDKELGSVEDFRQAWGRDLPMEAVEGLGKKANLDSLEFPGKKKKDTKSVSPTSTSTQASFKVVNLFLTNAQVSKWDSAVEKIMRKYKIENITDALYKLVTTCKEGK